jgi:hypothetical protein
MHVRRTRLDRYRLRAVCQEAPELRLRGCLKRWRRRVLEDKYFQHRPRDLAVALPAVSSRLTEMGMRSLWHEDQYQYRLHQLHRRKGFSALLKWAHSASRMR